MATTERPPQINMTRDVFIFQHDPELGGLVKCTPTNEEGLLGRRMAATLKLMCNDVAKKGSHNRETVIGLIELTVNNRKKGRGVVLGFPDGELKYAEVRTALVLACQYACGEYPMLQVDFDGKKATMVLNSGRDIISAFTGV